MRVSAISTSNPESLAIIFLCTTGTLPPNVSFKNVASWHAPPEHGSGGHGFQPCRMKLHFDWGLQALRSSQQRLKPHSLQQQYRHG